MHPSDYDSKSIPEAPSSSDQQDEAEQNSPKKAHGPEESTAPPEQDGASLSSPMVGQAPEPIEKLKEQMWPKAQERFKTMLNWLPVALQPYTQTPLVSLKWRPRSLESKDLPWRTLDVRIGGWTFKTSTATVTLEISSSQSTEKLNPSWQITPSSKSGSWELKLGGFATSKISIAPELRDDLIFPSETKPSIPQGAAALAFRVALMRAWFRPDDPLLDLGIEVDSSAIARSPLGEFWARFSEEDEKWFLPMPGGTIDGFQSERWAKSILSWLIWQFILVSYTNPTQGRGQELGLPKEVDYKPFRIMTLRVRDVVTRITNRGMQLPWHVFEEACTSLNSGKNVIFTGPPGCGKTELAVALAHEGSRQTPLVATASPAWTTGDLIGRYIPRRDGGLEFQPGFFLRAVREKRWLIIDEFNRAPIDACFGELFTVLAGQTVELPFRQLDEDGKEKPVRLVATSARNEQTPGKFIDYEIPPNFRLLGTMNDADRSELSRLSYALLRRVDIIRVEAPGYKELKAIIEQTLESASKVASLEQYGYIFGAGKGIPQTQASVALKKVVLDLLLPLFAGTEPGKHVSLGLVPGRIVGVATCKEAIQFMVEGLRCEDISRKCYGGPDEAEEVVVSYLAMTLVLKVFPQLDALVEDTRKRAVEIILRTFLKPKKFMLRRLDPLKENQDEALTSAGYSFRATEVSNPDPKSDIDSDNRMSVAEYVTDELCRQFRGTSEEDEYRTTLRRLWSEN